MGGPCRGIYGCAGPESGTPTLYGSLTLIGVGVCGKSPLLRSYPMAAQLAARAIQPTPAFITQTYTFEILPSGADLLAVRGGVDAVDALQHAQCLLDMSVTQAYAVSDRLQGTSSENLAWVLVHLLKQAKAVFEASVQDIEHKASQLEVQP